LSLRYDRQKQLMAQNATDKNSYDDARLEYEALRKRVSESKTALDTANLRMKETETLRKNMDVASASGETSGTLAQLLPLQREISVQQAEIDTLAKRREQLVLRAPASGQVSQIYHQPGETVAACEPLLSIAPENTNRVIAYVDEVHGRKLREGAEVRLTTRNIPREHLRAKIIKVGTAVAPIPIELSNNQRMTEYGLPILIGNIAADMLIPGERIDIRFGAARAE
jgi:HlyD family secretion protein